MEESEKIQELKDIMYTIVACRGYADHIRVEAAKAFAMLCNIKQENAEVEE